MLKIIIRALIGAAIVIAAPSRADNPAAVADHAISYDGDSNRISELTSPVYDLAGTPSEIIGKAQGCVPRALSTTGALQPSVLEALGGGFRPAQKDASPLIELVDRENGQLVANSFAAYQKGLLSYTARAKLLLQAKEGRFRVVQSDIAIAASSEPNNFSPAVTVWGTGWEAASKALISRVDKLKDCMTNVGGKGDDW